MENNDSTTGILASSETELAETTEESTRKHSSINNEEMKIGEYGSKIDEDVKFYGMIRGNLEKNIDDDISKLATIESSAKHASDITQISHDKIAEIVNFQDKIDRIDNDTEKEFTRKTRQVHPLPITDKVPNVPWLAEALIQQIDAKNARNAFDNLKTRNGQIKSFQPPVFRSRDHRIYLEQIDNQEPAYRAYVSTKSENLPKYQNSDSLSNYKNQPTKFQNEPLTLKNYQGYQTSRDTNSENKHYSPQIFNTGQSGSLHDKHDVFKPSIIETGFRPIIYKSNIQKQPERPRSKNIPVYESEVPEENYSYFVIGSDYDRNKNQKFSNYRFIFTTEPPPITKVPPVSTILEYFKNPQIGGNKNPSSTEKYYTEKDKNGDKNVEVQQSVLKYHSTTTLKPVDSRNLYFNSLADVQNFTQPQQKPDQQIRYNQAPSYPNYNLDNLNTKLVQPKIILFPVSTPSSVIVDLPFQNFKNVNVSNVFSDPDFSFDKFIENLNDKPIDIYQKKPAMEFNKSTPRPFDMRHGDVEVSTEKAKISGANQFLEYIKNTSAKNYSDTRSSNNSYNFDNDQYEYYYDDDTDSPPTTVKPIFGNFKVNKERHHKEFLAPIITSTTPSTENLKYQSNVHTTPKSTLLNNLNKLQAYSYQEVPSKPNSISTTKATLTSTFVPSYVTNDKFNDFENKEHNSSPYHISLTPAKSTKGEPVVSITPKSATGHRIHKPQQQNVTENLDVKIVNIPQTVPKINTDKTEELSSLPKLSPVLSTNPYKVYNEATKQAIVPGFDINTLKQLNIHSGYTNRPTIPYDDSSKFISNPNIQSGVSKILNTDTKVTPGLFRFTSNPVIYRPRYQSSQVPKSPTIYPEIPITTDTPNRVTEQYAITNSDVSMNTNIPIPHTGPEIVLIDIQKTTEASTHYNANNAGKNVKPDTTDNPTTVFTESPTKDLEEYYYDDEEELQTTTIIPPPSNDKFKIRKPEISIETPKYTANEFPTIANETFTNPISVVSASIEEDSDTKVSTTTTVKPTITRFTSTIRPIYTIKPRRFSERWNRPNSKTRTQPASPPKPRTNILYTRKNRPENYSRNTHAVIGDKTAEKNILIQTPILISHENDQNQTVEKDKKHEPKYFDQHGPTQATRQTNDNIDELTNRY